MVLTVPPAMETVSKALSEGLGIIKSVLEFNDLKAKLASFKPPDMNVFGPKIDLIFQAAKDVAARFVGKAQAAISQRICKTPPTRWLRCSGTRQTLSRRAIDTAAAPLLDPETQIPSIGQIDAKLTAVPQSRGGRDAAVCGKAASIGPDTAKSAEGLSKRGQKVGSMRLAR